MEEYNAATSPLNQSFNTFTTLQQVMDLNFDFWQTTISRSSKLPWNTQKDIMSVYLMKNAKTYTFLVKRCGEYLPPAGIN